MLYCFKSCTAHNLLLFYVMFLMIAVSLNRNARLQQENHFFSFSRKDTRISVWPLKKQNRRVTTSAIILSNCPLWQSRVTWKRLKKYLSATTEKISDYNLHFCENQAVDSVFGYIFHPCQKRKYSFHALVSLPTDLSIDEINRALYFPICWKMPSRQV